MAKAKAKTKAKPKAKPKPKPFSTDNLDRLGVRAQMVIERMQQGGKPKKVVVGVYTGGEKPQQYVVEQKDGEILSGLR